MIGRHTQGQKNRVKAVRNQLHEGGGVTPALEDPCFGGEGCVLGRPPVELGTFIHVVGTKSSRNAPADRPSAVWRNGTVARISGGRADLEPSPEAPLIIGPLVKDTGGGVLVTNYLKAVYEEVRLYKDYLTDDQIRALFAAGPTHSIQVPDLTDTGVEDTFATEFLSDAGTNYELECTTNQVDWEATGAIVEGTGSTLTLYDPSGYSTSKQYRVAIRF